MRFLAGARNDTIFFGEMRKRGDLPLANLPFSSQSPNHRAVILNGAKRNEGSLIPTSAAYLQVNYVFYSDTMSFLKEVRNLPILGNINLTNSV
jgi:hypothetical protein